MNWEKIEVVLSKYHIGFDFYFRRNTFAVENSREDTAFFSVATIFALKFIMKREWFAININGRNEVIYYSGRFDVFMIFKYFYDDFYIDRALYWCFPLKFQSSWRIYRPLLRAGNRRKNRTVEIRERYGCGMCQVKSAEGARYILKIK